MLEFNWGIRWFSPVFICRKHKDQLVCGLKIHQNYWCVVGISNDETRMTSHDSLLVVLQRFIIHYEDTISISRAKSLMVEYLGGLVIALPSIVGSERSR